MGYVRVCMCMRWAPDKTNSERETTFERERERGARVAQSSAQASWIFEAIFRGGAAAAGYFFILPCSCENRRFRDLSLTWERESEGYIRKNERAKARKLSRAVFFRSRAQNRLWALLFTVWFAAAAARRRYLFARGCGCFFPRAARDFVNIITLWWRVFVPGKWKMGGLSSCGGIFGGIVTALEVGLWFLRVYLCKKRWMESCEGLVVAEEMVFELEREIREISREIFENTYHRNEFWSLLHINDDA